MRIHFIIYLLVLFCLFLPLNAQWYFWPLYPVMERYCSGTFGEYRTGHFHEGIDIPASGSFTVYATTDSFKYIGNQWDPENCYIVAVQHYSQFDNTQWPLDEGSRYIHMNDIVFLTPGQVYIGQPLAENTGFVNNHLHFEMRWPAPVGVSGYERIFNAYNPFIEDNLCPDDGYEPYLDYLYVDGSTNHQGDATIEKWNFMGYNFDSYYNETATPPFVRLELPAETRDNDLDDPHILISGHCKVRFVLKAKDQVTSGYPNCAPYWISLYIDTALALGTEAKPVVNGTVPFYEVKFDHLENEYGEDEVYDEEDVYHTESPLVSTNSIFYYRLYPIDVNSDGYPSCILSGRWTVLKTEDLEEGEHRIRIVAKDYYDNVKTADVHFYIRRNDWVDYCRAFPD